MLNEFACSNIPDLYTGISTSSTNARSTGMECDVVEKAVRFVEGVHAFVGVSIPDLHGFIVAAADDQSTIGRESCATHPVRMLVQ